MTFDQLSDAAKVWFIVYSHIASRDGFIRWGVVARAVRHCGVPKEQVASARKEFESFLSHCHQLASQMRTQHRKSAQKSRK